jgi:hypothetical protein
MLHAVGALLPEYRVRAAVNLTDSTNLIHSDEYARRCGFRSALVPSASIYAYMSRSLVEFLGREWLERGSAEVRFIHPFYEADEVRVTGCLASVIPDGTLCIDYQAFNGQGVACAAGCAKLPPAPPVQQPSLCDYPAGRKKLGRSISLESLIVGSRLTPVKSDFTWNIHWEYCQKAIRDHHPIYQHTLHPGWLLARADQMMSANFDLQTWMLAACAVQNYRAQCSECVIETRGFIVHKFEQKGHHYVVLDLGIFNAELCLATIRYTAIFQIAPKAA